MQNKLGTIAERLIGARFYFAPDGVNIGTELEPVIIGLLVKPADQEDWNDFDAGRCEQLAYDPAVQTRERTWFSPELGRYVTSNDPTMTTDAFNATMVDYATDLFDEIMFGLDAAIEDGVEQDAFAKTRRYKDGWARLIRWNEDKTVLCQLDFRVRLSIQTNPADSNQPGSPVWRLEARGDEAAGMRTIVFRPEAEEEEGEG